MVTVDAGAGRQAIETALARLEKAFLSDNGRWVWKEEDLQSCLYSILLEELGRIDGIGHRARRLVHREWFTRNKYKRDDDGWYYAVPSGSRRLFGKYDVVLLDFACLERNVIGPTDQVWTAFEIKYSRSYETGFTSRSNKLVKGVQHDIVKLTEKSDGAEVLARRDQRHLVLFERLAQKSCTPGTFLVSGLAQAPPNRRVSLDSVSFTPITIVDPFPRPAR